MENFPTDERRTLNFELNAQEANEKRANSMKQLKCGTASRTAHSQQFVWF